MLSERHLVAEVSWGTFPPHTEQQLFETRWVTHAAYFLVVTTNLRRFGIRRRQSRSPSAVSALSLLSH